MDDTAKAGEDYESQSGTLNFAPLEVSTEVLVPLIAKGGATEPLTFKLALSGPSAGYAVIPTTPISILPELQIAVESLQPQAPGAVIIRLDHTQRGRWYIVEESANLQDWIGIAGADAVGNILRFDLPPRNSSARFFRAYEQ